MKITIEYFEQALSWLVKLEIMASVVALAMICILTLVQIVVRELGGSLLWAEEVSLLMMKIVVFQGAAGMYAKRAYIYVDGLTMLFPRRVQWALNLIGWVLIGGFAALLTYQGIKSYPSQIQIRSYLLQLPKFYFTLPLILGAATIFLASVYYLIATLIAGPGKQDAEIDAHVRGLAEPKDP